ncbi:MAG: alpha/beta fold hydrolase [Parvularculaceae bacterium]|nr:alpha/beta fold hydrolase [Parvularculaceae bacterium]
MSETKTSPREEAGSKMRALVERTIQRNIKGLQYFASAAPAVGQTPKDVIYKRGTLNLYHYRPVSDEIYRTPVLLVMATTNKAYIFDIAPGQSLVEFLLKKGYDVFAIDWDPPRPEEKRLRLDDYTQDFIPDCVRRVGEATGEPDVSIIGYCMGGVLSTIYASTHTDGPLRNLILFTTPIDWSKMGLFAVWSDPKYFDVDRLVDSVGNVPADLLMASFDMLRPAGRTGAQIQLWDNMWNDEFVASWRKFDRWANEMLPLAGEYFRQTTKDLLRDNKLFKGELRVGGKVASISNIKVPVLHAIAEHDHIIPREASEPLVKLVSSTDKHQIVLKGGHVSLVAGPNAVRRLWPQIDLWLSERSV